MGPNTRGATTGSKNLPSNEYAGIKFVNPRNMFRLKQYLKLIEIHLANVSIINGNEIGRNKNLGVNSDNKTKC